MPPRIPPALLVPETGVSLFWEPFKAAAAKPAPNSTPFAAPMESIAPASRASSLPKTGSPRPGGRDSLHQTGDYAPGAVTLGAYRFNGFQRLFRRYLAGGPQRVALNFVNVKIGVAGLGHIDSGNGRRPGRYADTVRGEELFCNCPGGNAAQGFPAGTSAAAAVIADAVFGVPAKIRVTGPANIAYIIIVRRVAVGVAHQYRNGRAQGFTFKHAGQNFRLIGLAAAGGRPALTRPPPPQLAGDVLKRKRDPRRAAVDYTAQSRPVGFAKRDYLKNFAKTISRH